MIKIMEGYRIIYRFFAFFGPEKVRFGVGLT